MVAVSTCFASVVLLAGSTAGFRISKREDGNSKLLAGVPVLSNIDAAYRGEDGWNLTLTDAEKLDQLDAVDLTDHPLHGKTFSLFVHGGSQNRWLGFGEPWPAEELLYAKYRRGEAMPTHLIRYPGYPNTYILRNDWEGMQKYVCMSGAFDKLKHDCDDRSSAIPVEFRRQSNGQYKLFNRQRGNYKYICLAFFDQVVASRCESNRAMRVSLTEEPNLLAPYTVRICYEAILAHAGGSAGNASYWVEHKHGKTQTKEYTNEIIAETSLGIDLDFPFLEFLGSPSVTSSLKALAKHTSSLTTDSMITKGYNITVDLSKPCYVYSAEVTTEYKNSGVVVQKSAFRHQILPAPLSVTCVMHEM